MPFSTVTGVTEERGAGRRLARRRPSRRTRPVRRLWRAVGAVRASRSRRSSGPGSPTAPTGRCARARCRCAAPDQRSPAGTGPPRTSRTNGAAEQARRDAEERLRESEEMHRHTLELSQQIVWTVEPDGRLATISQRYQELTGIDGGDDAPHVDPSRRPRPWSLARWTDGSGSGMPYHVECRLRMADGSYRLFRVRARRRTATRRADPALVRHQRGHPRRSARRISPAATSRSATGSPPRRPTTPSGTMTSSTA